MSTQPVVTALSRGATADFAELAGRYLEEYLAKIEVAVASVDEMELWWRPAQATNSIGNLILHLRGNLSLWIGEGVGLTACDRDRASEFSADRSHDGPALIDALAEEVSFCQGTLDSLDPGDLVQEIDVQGYQTTILGAIFHAVEHMGYHTGQILYAAKQILGERSGGHGIELYPQHAGE